MGSNGIWARRALTPPAALLAALAAGACATAHAGRPFATEDAGVLARGACEWESVAARTRVGDGTSERAVSTQLGCGLGLNTQAALSHTRSRAGDERTRAWALDLKTGLLEAGEDGGTSLSLAYGADAARDPPQAAYRAGTTSINLVATRPLGGGWTGHVNLGWARDHPAGRDSATWALAAEWALNGSFDLGAETYGDDRARPWLGGGARWTLSPAWSLNASYAVNTASPRARLASVGFKFGF